MARKKQQSTTQWVDISLHSAIAGCSCGWRASSEPSRRAAWALAHTHALASHPGQSQYALDRLRYNEGPTP